VIAVSVATSNVVVNVPPVVNDEIVGALERADTGPTFAWKLSIS
jgi:hypothetical protein